MGYSANIFFEHILINSIKRHYWIPVQKLDIYVYTLNMKSYAILNTSPCKMIAVS